MNSYRLAEWQGIAALARDTYDLMIVTAGYEERSIFIAQHARPKVRHRLAASFPVEHVLSYSRNEAWLRESGTTVDEVSDDEYGLWLNDVLKNHAPRSDCRILVDVSSMSRVRIATCVIALWRLGQTTNLVADFAYSAAMFDPPASMEPPIVVCEPVLPELAGWSSNPSLPSAVVIGLGYERDKAVGALEYLEPGAVWGFVPRGWDTRYDDAVEAANASLWSFRPTPTRVSYNIASPLGCLTQLEALAHGLAPRYRPVIVPFGPKVFALAAMFTAVIHQPDVAVWRVSSRDQGQPADRKPSGTVVGLRLLTAT